MILTTTTKKNIGKKSKKLFNKLKKCSFDNRAIADCYSEGCDYA